MSVDTLTYAALGARLKISREAGRSLTRRLRLPRSLSDDGKALVSVDLAEIRHTHRPPAGRQAGNVRLLAAKIEALKGESARLDARAAYNRADFERERERTDRLTAELLQATAETMAANEVTARLEGEVAALRRVRRSARRPATPKGDRNMRAMRLRRASIRMAAPLLCAIRSRKMFSMSRPSCDARPTEPP
jgi:hypothetical protein